MAKRKTSMKSAAPAPVKRRASRARTFYRSARGASRKSGMRWGEVALSALVGYEGDKVLQPFGGMIGSAMQKNEYTSAYLSDTISSTPGQDFSLGAGRAVNKAAGLAALLKAAYDVVKHKKLSESDKNILIPYGVGTVFDSNAKDSNVSGGWK